jgi:hypothetical protein
MHSIGINVRKLLTVTCLALASLINCSAANKDGAFPRLLPSAEEFRLILREDPQSKLLLGPSCAGEASLTLMCRGFVVTLQNVGSHIVRIDGMSCAEPSINFEMKQPNSSSGWWTLSQPVKSTCLTREWTNTRLRPGEHTQYSTRLISERRWMQSVGPGQYTIRAHWILRGCTDESEGADCLTPLQVVRGANKIANIPDVAIQEPVEVVSNEVTAESPTLPDLGAMKFSFEVNVIPSSMARKLAPVVRAKCADEGPGSISCAVFHYKVGNAGTRAVHWMQLGCTDFGIFPEYLADGQWSPVLENLPCTVNVLNETPILPGSVVEGDFTLTWGYDISPFRTPGEYTFRLILRPQACFASPDGSFCLDSPHSEPPITSGQLTVRTH